MEKFLIKILFYPIALAFCLMFILMLTVWAVINPEKMIETIAELAEKKHKEHQ